MVAVTTSTSTPNIVGIFGLPVDQAVITQGRGRDRGPPTETTTWGLRPKMRVVFTLPEEPQAIWYKGTVKLNTEDAPEYSYQELKYSQLPADSAYWREQFELEQAKWHSPKLEHWDDFVALRTFRPCEAPHEKDGQLSTTTKTEQHYYEFDYYPCSFWLQEGFTHSKMDLQIQVAQMNSAIDAPIYHPDFYIEDVSKWSCATKWNSKEDYSSEKQTQEILERLAGMSERDHLTLDRHTSDLLKRLPII